MPTERFNRLSADKKKLIREAALEEFTRVPFEKASINQIIQKAGISRGSFYTYFEDKRDLLHYIFQDSARQLGDFCELHLTESGGDLWWVLQELLDYNIKRANHANMIQLSRNILMYEDMEKLFGYSDEYRCVPEETARHTLSLIYEKTDKTRFRIHTLEEFEIFMQLAMSILMWALGQYYAEPKQEENIKKLFRKKLDFLRYGICIQPVQ